MAVKLTGSAPGAVMRPETGALAAGDSRAVGGRTHLLERAGDRRTRCGETVAGDLVATQELDAVTCVRCLRAANDHRTPGLLLVPDDVRAAIARAERTGRHLIANISLRGHPWLRCTCGQTVRGDDPDGLGVAYSVHCGRRQGTTTRSAPGFAYFPGEKVA